MPRTAQEPEKKKITIPVILTALLLLIITISFLFTGSPNTSLTSNDLPVLAKFNGRDIYATDPLFGRFYSNYQYLYQLYGMNPTEDDLSSMALRQTVQTYALAEEAKSAGIPVNRKEVAREEIKYPIYLDSTGKFSKLKYDKVSGAERKSISDMLSVLNLSQYVENDFSDINTVSASEKKAISMMASEQRKISYVTINADTYPESKLADYGKSKPELFVQLTLSRMTTQKSASNLKKIRQSIIKDPAQWDELVKVSDDPYSQDGGKMGEIYSYQINSELTNEADFNKVLALKKGEISDVFETEDAYVFFRADEDPVQPDFTDSDLLKIVYAYILSKDDTVIINYLRETADSLVSKMKATSFVEAAVEASLTIHQTGFFGLNYGGLTFMPALTADDNDTTLNATNKNREFFKQVFALKPEEIAPSLPLLNKIIVYKLDETKTLSPEELTTVESSVESVLSNQTTQDLSEYLKLKYKSTY